MKLKYRFLSFVLAFAIIFNSSVITVYADDDDSHSISLSTFWKGLTQQPDKLAVYAFSNLGAIINGDFANYISNIDAFNDLINGATETTATNPKTGNEEKAILINSSITQSLIDTLNVYVEDNANYTLMPTTKFSSLKASYFYTTDIYKLARYLVSKYGVICIYRNSGTYTFLDLSDTLNYYVVRGNNTTSTYDGVTYDTSYIKFYKQISSSTTFFPKLWSGSYSGFEFDSDTDYGSDGSSISSTGNLYLDGTFRSSLAYYTGNNYTLYKYLFGSSIVVSSSGFSYPVFDTIDDAVDYQMQNGLYYTTNDYTGVGKDIYIFESDFDTINNTDYSKLYDLLVSMIIENQNNGVDLSYEDLSVLTQSVIDSISEVNGTISSDDAVTNSLLQNILDALNDFKEKYVPFSSSNVTYTTVLTAIKGNLDTIKDYISSFQDSMDSKLDDIYKMLKSIRNWTIADTVTDLADTIADWADFVADLLKDVGTGVAVIADSVSSVADTMTKKFPFSIPWDIAFLIAFLADTPAVPVFEVPFNFPAYGIEYTFTFDFSQFAVVSKVCRLLLTILFALGLLKLTNKIVSMKKR